MIRVGVIGYGYWGPNLVRNFADAAGSQVTMVSDLSADRLAKAARRYPAVRVTRDHRELIEHTTVDLVVIATPVSTHFDLAMQALRAGKHVLVEKPLAATSEQGLRLMEEAERRRLTLAVDHTFVYTGAVRKIRELVTGGAIGEIDYYDSVRVNLGLFQHDVNVIWDLAPHDLSIMSYLIKAKPEAVSASGQVHLNGFEDLAYMTVFFSDKIIAHINVNWLSPVKVRTTLIGGEKKMVVWNDLDADEKVKVYDKGVAIKNGEGVHELLVSYRSGDMWAPKVEQTEALASEARYFVDCVQRNRTPFNDGEAGLGFVKILEAADQSLQAKGRPVTV